jgi:hypothetical protein
MSESIRSFAFTSLVLAATALTSACSAHYVRRGRPADLGALSQEELARNAATDERAAESLSLRALLERQPAAAFPAALAVVRVQARERGEPVPPWERPAARTGHFEVVTLRDVESDECLARLRALPEVRGIAGANAMLVSGPIEDEVDLRKLAAQLGADVLLAYTLDTHEELDDESPLFSALTLGLLPTHEIEVRTTAAAVLLDTRTGYCYGAAEGSAARSPHTSYWRWEEATDDARLANEREAFAKLVTAFEDTWRGVVAAHATPVPTQ